MPSYLQSWVNSTVRMGTLMPTPRVSVPQMTLRCPSCASRSTRRRYLGSIPAWWTPMPWRTKRLSARPNPAPNRNSPMAAPMASFSAREHMFTLISDCARSTASRWVKCTTYTGTRSVSSSVSIVSCRAVRRYSYSSGTGRVALRIAAVVRPVRSLSSSSNRRVSPSVADISRNCAWGSVSSGTCHAQPRSGSA